MIHASVVETYPFDAVGKQPVETFDEEQKTKHERERNVEFITEDGERKQRLSDKEPHAVVKPLEEMNKIQWYGCLLK